MLNSLLKKRAARSSAKSRPAVDSALGVPYPYPYQVTARPLYRDRPTVRPVATRHLGGLWSRMKGLFGKLRSREPKKPRSLEQWHGDGIANAPLVGATGDRAPLLRLESLTPGYWRGEAAKVVLLDLEHDGLHIIPKAIVEVVVKPVDHTQVSKPNVVAAGPFKVVAEEQPTERTKGVKGHGDVGGGAAGLANASTGLEVEQGSTQHDTSRGLFTAKPTHCTADGCQGVEYVVLPPPGSKHGIPPSVRLVLVYTCEGPVRFEAEVTIKGTPRTLTVTPKRRDSFEWSQDRWLGYQLVKCAQCEKRGQECQDFSHPDQEFWYSLLNQSDLDNPVRLPFSNTTRARWFSAFVRAGGTGKPEVGSSK